MDRFTADLDRQLGEWLRDESATQAPTGLAEEVFRRTSGAPQVRRWWPLTLSSRGRADARRIVAGPLVTRFRPASALTGTLAVVVVATLLAFALRSNGPAHPGGPTPSPSPVASASPSPSPSRVATEAPAPTPLATVLGDAIAMRLNLGNGAGPIGVIEAFGSIWVADIHASDVRRFDPATMTELARMSVRGAAWFAATEDALWVTNQGGTGVDRIDPATNTVTAHIGSVPPCAAPVVTLDSVWVAACDADQILRIDAATNAIVDTIPAKRHIFLALAAGQLYTIGSEGLARLDPDTGTFTGIPNPAVVAVDYFASDGETLWVKNRGAMVRIDPTDGHTIATFADSQAMGVAFSGGRAWLTVGGVGVREIDMSTNAVLRTIPGLAAPLIPYVASDGVLWVTDFDNSILWRIVP